MDLSKHYWFFFSSFLFRPLFLSLKKKVFFFKVVQGFIPPPLLVVRPLNKPVIFCVSPLNIHVYDLNLENS